jgi:segregation and condensation protein B
VSRDEAQESLASQAAAWVPPWERALPEPDEELPDGEPGTPELDEASELDDETRQESHDEVEVTADTGPVPEPVEADVVDPEGEELLPEAAGARAEEVGEATPEAAEEPAAEELMADEEPAAVEPAGGEPAAEELAAEEVTAEELTAEEFATEQAAADGDEHPSTGQLALEGMAPPPGELPATELRAALEAIMLVVDEPVAESTLAQALEQPTDRIAAALRRLADEYAAQDRGFELRRAAGGWRLYTRSRYAPYVERFVLDGQSIRLTQAALETLAVVAYKQPVTRARISAIRGVNCDGVVRTLVTRGLIEDCGSEPETGAHLYRTTGLFLEKLGLDTVDQLPPLAPFLPDDVDAIADAQSA